MFHNQNVIIYTEFVHICSGWDTTHYRRIALFCNTIRSLRCVVYVLPHTCTVYPKKYAHGFCFVVVIHWLIFPYPPGLLHWHCGNLTIAPVPAKQPWWIWINTSCEFIMNDCITTTKQCTTKPCAYFLGYTVCNNSDMDIQRCYTVIVRSHCWKLFWTSIWSQYL